MQVHSQNHTFLGLFEETDHCHQHTFSYLLIAEDGALMVQYAHLIVASSLGHIPLYVLFVEELRKHCHCCKPIPGMRLGLHEDLHHSRWIPVRQKVDAVFSHLSVKNEAI